MVRAACSGNTTVSIVAFAVVGCLVELNPHLSRLQEVVICWLSLNLVLVLLVLLILAGVVCQAGECVMVWVRKAARITPKSCACEIQLILAAGKVEVSFRPTTDREGRTELSPNSSWM